jgi:hypothetical protein
VYYYTWLQICGIPISRQYQILNLDTGNPKLSIQRDTEKFCPQLIFLNNIPSKIIQEAKQSERQSNLTEQERYTKRSAKAKQRMKKQSIVKNLKWLEKILSMPMGNAHERKDVLQMWNTRFSGWIPDFKLLD